MLEDTQHPRRQTHILTLTCIQTFTHANTLPKIVSHLHTQTHMYVCIYIVSRLYVYTCVYTYSYTHPRGCTIATLPKPRARAHTHSRVAIHLCPLWRKSDTTAVVSDKIHRLRPLRGEWPIEAITAGHGLRALWGEPPHVRGEQQGHEPLTTRALNSAPAQPGLTSYSPCLILTPPSFTSSHCSVLTSSVASTLINLIARCSTHTHARIYMCTRYRSQCTDVNVPMF